MKKACRLSASLGKSAQLNIRMAEDNRSLESFRRQYEVEKDLHGRLMNSTRAQRTTLFAELYDELFRRVPDHPRLTRRDTEEFSRRAVAARMNILRPHLAGVKTFMEIAPGDCRLAFEMCQHVEKVIALDISDQSGGQQNAPKNFHFETYDGYTLNLPPNSVDVAFSYQFLEHVHPDDHEDHFRNVLRVLRPGGVYIFDTPHKYSGPHDASFIFSVEAEGMHLREWTYREMNELVRRMGFSESYTYRFGKCRQSALWNALTFTVEALVGALPVKLRKAISRRLFLGVTMLVRK